MAICACGCGGMTRGGDFLPVHDQRRPAQIERTLGGLMALRALAEDAAADAVTAGATAVAGAVADD
ncbi:MAG: hypothetical protein ACU0CC_21335 [Sagittula sp.]|uniref:hypothetical protein n=2 Tax=Sagittula sp. TaxID=2038081 RepID=UPI004059F73D